jgi:hypothetical protein
MLQYAESPPHTDARIPTGRITAVNLANGCYTFGEVCALAATDLTRRGEAAAVLAQLGSGGVTVRDYLRERYGAVTGPREYYTPPHITPDAADLKMLRAALRRAGAWRRPQPDHVPRRPARRAA